MSGASPTAPADGLCRPTVSEHSTGERVRRGRITKAGNGRARRRWSGGLTYTHPARGPRPRGAGHAGAARIADKARHRLSARYRKLRAAASWPQWR